MKLGLNIDKKKTVPCSSKYYMHMAYQSVTSLMQEVN